MEGTLGEETVTVSDKKKSLRNAELETPKGSEFLTENFWRNVTPKGLKEKLKSVKNINKIKTKDNQNMLCFLVRYGKYPEMVSLLINAGVDYSIKSSVDGGKALHYAVIRKEKTLEFTKEILKYDTNVNEHKGKGTALIWALYWRAPIELIKLLLEKGADPHFQMENGSHSLIAASTPNRFTGEDFINPEVIKLLLNYKVDITMKNSERKIVYDFMKENKDFKKTELFKKIPAQFQNNH